MPSGILMLTFLPLGAVHASVCPLEQPAGMVHSILTSGSLAEGLAEVNLPTVLIGTGAVAFLFWVRKGLKPLLLGLGLGPRAADLLAKAGPVGAVVVTTLISWGFGLSGRGVAIVGAVPQGLPPLTVPSFDLDIWSSLIGSAVLMGVAIVADPVKRCEERGGTFHIAGRWCEEAEPPQAPSPR